MCFSISGENLTGFYRSGLFKAILRQEVGWFDDEENSTANLSTKLSKNAGEISGVCVCVCVCLHACMCVQMMLS